ncbi:MAG: RNA polymerase sigma factor [Planctomycetes bacterium]|nr:RNA polymerase sigma factor [Planctomycetota bacterium]
MTRDEEQRIILKAAAGSRAAASQLIDAHQKSLYAYLVRLTGRPHVAEDVVQEAFIRALTHLDRFDPKFRFSTWLFTIAKRVYLNMSAKMSPRFSSDAVDMAASGGEHAGDPCPIVRSGITRSGLSADESECNNHLKDALQQALMQLPFVQREVLILFHQHEWPIWLIAQHLDIPEGTVKSHLHRARGKMREVLTSSPELSKVVAEAWS